MQYKITLKKLPSFFSWISFTFLLISLSCLNTILYGQSKVGYYPVSEIKKKDGKWGIKASRDWELHPSSRDWIIIPTYDRIELVGYMAKHGRYFAYYAWKADKLDVFSEKSLAPIINNISIEDTIHIASFAVFANPETKPFLENKLCGWKHKQAVIPPQFDSIRLAFDSRREIYLDEIKVYKNGQMGLMSKDGSSLIPLGDYSDIGPYLPGHTIIYGKLSPSGGRLEGIYFDGNKKILPVYTSLKYVTSIQLNDKWISYNNTEIPGFYSCELPNGSSDYFVHKNSALVRLPEELSLAYRESKNREILQKKNAEAAIAAKRTWVNGLVLFAKGGRMGIMDADGIILLPTDATALGLGRFSIDADDDTIIATMVYSGNKELKLSFKTTVPMTKFLTEYDDMSKFTIMAELNPYNSKSGDYKTYFDVEINQSFNYKSGFRFGRDSCPECDGEGKLYDGVISSSKTITSERRVKDGTTTITRKNYLANERVDANGKVHIPTTTQTYDNYKTVKETEKVVTKTIQYKTCTLCEGRKTFKYAMVAWDDKRSEYVATLNF